MTPEEKRITAKRYAEILRGAKKLLNKEGYVCHAISTYVEPGVYYSNHPDAAALQEWVLDMIYPRLTIWDWALNTKNSWLSNQQELALRHRWMAAMIEYMDKEAELKSHSW